MFFIIVKLANLCRSFIVLSAHIPKSLKENFIMIWESFGMLYPLKYMLNRGISVTLGTITFLCDTFMILLPITLLWWGLRRHFLFLMNNFIVELLTYSSWSFPLMIFFFFLCPLQMMCREELNPASLQLLSTSITAISSPTETQHRHVLEMLNR